MRSDNKQTYKAPKDLPLYKATLKLIEVVDDIHDTFRRDRRHTYWQSICNTVDRLPRLVCVASDFPSKREEALMDMLGEISVLQSKLDIYTTRGYITGHDYLLFAKPISSIERQANGWLKATNAGVETGILESAV